MILFIITLLLVCFVPTPIQAAKSSLEQKKQVLESESNKSQGGRTDKEDTSSPITPIDRRCTDYYAG